MPVNNTDETVDANTINTTCWKKVASGSQNIPSVSSPNGCWLLTLYHGNGYVMQVFISRDAAMYIRSINGSSWSAWKQLAFVS